MEEENNNKQTLTDSRLWVGSVSDNAAIKVKIKEYGFEDYADDISIACYDMGSDDAIDYQDEGIDFVEYRREECEAENNNEIKNRISLIRFLKNMPSGDSLKISSSKQMSTIKLDSDTISFLYESLLESFIRERWYEYVPSILKDTYSEEAALRLCRKDKKCFNEILDYEERRLKTAVPLEYYTGHVLSDAATKLRAKDVFDKSVKTLRIKEACLLYDALVIFGAKEEDGKPLTRKQKYDFVKNKIKAYQDYISKKH